MMDANQVDRAGSIRDMESCRAGARLLRDGFLVGTFIRGVCGIWVDGGNPDAVERVFQVKGEQRHRRPFGTTLDASAFVQYVNRDQIPAAMHNLLLNEEELVGRLGSLCFIRVPIWKEAGDRFPQGLISQTPDGTYWLQNWLPEGSPTTRKWVEAVKREAVELPVATSMNVSGQPELVDAAEGLQFCSEHAIPLFLDDPEKKEKVRGSFPVIQADREGIKLVREGHFPAALFRYLLDGWDIDLSQAQPAKFPVLAVYGEEDARKMSPHQLREEMINQLD
jgi:tRNA A37 threonylcarbamoyladenosine synthetase subunit TsaC/SUA5/YrdC